MKSKLFIVILMLGMSITFIRAEVVPGFSYSEVTKFTNAARMDLYEDKGYGGNEFYWSVQNRADFGVNLRPFIYVDDKSKPYEEYRILPGCTEHDFFSVSKDIRKDPYSWRISFEFYWDEYANLFERKVWINYNATNWRSEEYEEINLPRTVVKDR